MPDVDLEPLYLLDQDQDRFSCRAEFIASIGGKAGSPAFQSLELLIVEAAGHSG